MNADTINMIRAEKAVLCPLSGNYHPVGRCSECSCLHNRINQVLFDGLTLEYIFCSYDGPDKKGEVYE